MVSQFPKVLSLLALSFAMSGCYVQSRTRAPRARYVAPMPQQTVQNATVYQNGNTVVAGQQQYNGQTTYIVQDGTGAYVNAGYYDPYGQQPVIVNNAPPPRQVFNRPVAPFGGAVWVDGHWRWNGNQYMWVNGRYIRPRGQNYTYVQPGWSTYNGRYVYTRGHWRHRNARAYHRGRPVQYRYYHQQRQRQQRRGVVRRTVRTNRAVRPNNRVRNNRIRDDRRRRGVRRTTTVRTGRRGRTTTRRTTVRVR